MNGKTSVLGTKFTHTTYKHMVKFPIKWCSCWSSSFDCTVTCYNNYFSTKVNQIGFQSLNKSLLRMNAEISMVKGGTAGNGQEKPSIERNFAQDIFINYFY